MYRNSIFHTSFLIDYKVNLAERNIIFKDLNGEQKNLGIKEFIGSFFRLITVVYTFISCVLLFPYKINKEKITSETMRLLEPIIEAFTKIDKEDLIKKFEEIKEDLDKNYSK